MTAAAWVLMALFMAVAAVDWLAVHSRSSRSSRSKAVEYLAKPGCMVMMIAAAIVMEPQASSARVLLVVALVGSTTGDVFLMLPERPPRARGLDWFVAGLGAFLGAHVAYVVAFALVGVRFGWAMLGLVAAVVILTTIGRRVVAAVRSTEPALATPVTAYVAVISVMVAAAIGTADPRAIGGALLFAGSDSLIAWGRFVRAQPWFPLAVIVTYHLAQALLVLSFSG